MQKRKANHTGKADAEGGARAVEIALEMAEEGIAPERYNWNNKSTK